MTTHEQKALELAEHLAVLSIELALINRFDWANPMLDAGVELQRLAAVEAELAALKEAIRGLEPVGSVFTMEALDGRGVEKSHATLTKSLPAGTKLYTLPPNLKGTP